MKTIYPILIALLITSTVFSQVKIQISLNPQLKGPFTGRLLIYTLSDTTKQFGNGPTENEAAYVMQVNNWLAPEVKEVNSDVQYLKTKISALKDGYYKMVALLDTNTRERGTSAPGNLYTRKEIIMQVKDGRGNAELKLTNAFQTRPFKENDSIKEVVLKSKLLSKFRKESIYMKAGIVLPASYQKDTAKTYPVVFVIPGWGGTHHQALSSAARNNYGIGQGLDKIFVFLNPETQTPFGLHGFIDSKVNGPWGKALVMELMPYLQRTFRASVNPKQNLLTGQSTGGYSVVWLSFNYPESFGGAWASAPDPLDFSSFTGVDLYRDVNYYKTSEGEERGFNLEHNIFLTTLRKTSLMETFEGDGGQLQSFEAGYGLMSADGKPERLFDLETGQINKSVASKWRNYDMSAFALRNSMALRRKLQGPVRIYVGDKDNFLLNTSALGFAEKIKSIGLPVKVKVISDADHFHVRTPQVVKEIAREMDALISAGVL